MVKRTGPHFIEKGVMDGTGPRCKLAQWGGQKAALERGFQGPTNMITSLTLLLLYLKNAVASDIGLHEHLITH